MISKSENRLNSCLEVEKRKSFLILAERGENIFANKFREFIVDFLQKLNYLVIQIRHCE